MTVLAEQDLTGDIQNFSNRWGAKIRLWVLHTQEGPGTARSLMNYFRQAEVSYHYVADNKECLAVGDTDKGSWSVLDANPYTINFCFAGSRASMSTDEWLRNYSDAIDTAAWLFVRDAKKYGIDARTLSFEEIRAGRSGGTDHNGITKGLNIGTHTDCGPNFPWAFYQDRIRVHLAGGAVKPPVQIANAIAEMYKSAPWLGAKTTKEVELVTPDKRGRYAFYEQGAIYWTPQTGARPIPNYLLDVYARNGYETGPLGYPTMFNSILEDGEVQGFEFGAVYRKGHPGKDEQPGFIVHGNILAAWRSTGFEKGTFGWPTSNEVQEGENRIQQFENGQLIYSPSGVVALKPRDGADEIVKVTTH